MKRNLAIVLGLSTTCLAVASPSLPEGLKFKGWVDLFYQYDFNRSPFGRNLTGREFDLKAGAFELANAELNMVYAKKGAPFSVVLDLGTGRNVEINNGLDAKNAHHDEIVQQFYLSLPQKDGSTLDLGKFNTWIGLESVYTVDNPNYSLGSLFWYAQPNWHVGMRWTKPFNDTSTGALYVVNGWNEIQDTNGSKTLGASYAKTISKKLSATFGYIGGKEGTNGIGLPNIGQSDVHMADLIATYTVSDKHTIMFNGDYASSAGANSGHWYGYSVYSNHKLSDSKDASIRFSIVNDPQMLRGAPGSISSWTGTYNVRTTEASTIRLELRFDQANSNYFQNGAAGFSNNRTTLTIAQVLRF
ncbi:MAG: outer membrane beta-barrel protein [Armatimonadetes bacterium]|nr:outer membrane beta-barrel protein [Armatimonadota bacterium]MBS1726696.1 outer membrane beta-barrel protein [Armatimonadota bacterium]